MARGPITRFLVTGAGDKVAGIKLGMGVDARLCRLRELKAGDLAVLTFSEGGRTLCVVRRMTSRGVVAGYDGGRERRFAWGDIDQAYKVEYVLKPAPGRNVVREFRDLLEEPRTAKAEGSRPATCYAEAGVSEETETAVKVARELAGNRAMASTAA